MVATLLVTVTAPLSLASAAGGDGPRTLTDPAGSGITVTVSPALAQVRQGDAVHLHFAGLEAGEVVYGVGTCPAGLSLAELNTTLAFVGTQACSARLPTGLVGDTDPTSINNPGLSTSLFNAYPSPDGTLDVDFLVGGGTSVGTLAYILNLKNGTRTVVPSLTCDADHPCAIGFTVVHKDGVTRWIDVSSLTVAPAPSTTVATGACTGISATTTVRASGPARLQDPLAALERAYCGTAASTPVPVSFIPNSAGEDDPAAVPAVGGSANLAFVGSPALSRSSTPLGAGKVAVPIALNAVSVAQIGGLRSPSLTPGHFSYTVQNPALALTPSDIARIVLHDFPLGGWASPLPTTLAAGQSYNPLGGALLTRPGNADALAGIDVSLIGLPFTAAPTVTFGLGLSSTAVALSSYLSTESATAWSYPANPVNAGLHRVGTKVAKVTDFADIVGPNVSPYTSQTSTIGGLYSAKYSKDITTGSWGGKCPAATTQPPDYEIALTKGCLRFGVMDTATAATVSLTSARLQAGSTFLAPTPPALTAAAGGQLNDDGYFTATGNDAYPLTFVEYAVVPTTAFAADQCAQQATVKDFLGYAVGAGQQKLGAGLAPLTPGLVAQAKAAIATIGTTPVVGSCKPPAPAATSTPTATPTASPNVPSSSSGGSSLTGSSGSSGSSGSGVSTGSGGSSGSSGTSGSLSSSASGSASTAPSSSNAPTPTPSPSTTLTPGPVAAQPVAFEAAPFQGAAGSTATSTVLGLAGLLLLLSVGAMWASGRIPEPSAVLRAFHLGRR